MTTDKSHPDTPEKKPNTITKLHGSKLQGSKLHASESPAPNLRGKTILSFDDEKCPAIKDVAVEKECTGTDIDRVVSKLDADLSLLRFELHAINTNVDEGLNRLSDTDTGLTAKVSETYKCLGAIDNAYKSLLSISSCIDNDFHVLNDAVIEADKQAAAELNGQEKPIANPSPALTNEGQFHVDLLQDNESLNSRIKQLKEDSSFTTNRLHKSIHETVEKISLLEKNVISQIETLSNTSLKKSESIAKAVEQNSAKLLKSQSVDEAIIRRTTTLEITAAELSAKGQDIDDSVELLQLNIDTLKQTVKKLNSRTNSLEAIANHHDAAINGLQKDHAEMTDELLSLDNSVKRVFNVTAAGFSLLLVASAGVFVYQKDYIDTSAFKFAVQSKKTVSVETDVPAVDEIKQVYLDNKVKTDASIAALEEKVKQMSISLGNVQKKSVTTEEKINQSGKKKPIVKSDANIHGPQWVTSLPAGNFVIQLAYVDNKGLIDGIVQSYKLYLNEPLKESLSYFVANDNNAKKYILLAGNYVSVQQAISAVRSLPRHIETQKPVIRRVSNIQNYINASGAV